MQQQFIDDYFKQNKNNLQQLKTSRKPALVTSNTDGNSFKNSIMQHQQQPQQSFKRDLPLSNHQEIINTNNDYEPQQKYFAYDENNVITLLDGIYDNSKSLLPNKVSSSETSGASAIVRMPAEGKSRSKWPINDKERDNNNNNNNNNINKIQLDYQLRTVAGSVEKILKYKELAGNIDIIYELFSDILSVRKGKKEYENILLLRNSNSGPVLQAIYYEIDCKFPVIFPGDSVRCIGKFIGNSRFNIMKITKNTLPHIELIKRLENIGTYILNKENRQISCDF